ncbi:TPA: phage portal protein [Escherichia coli]|nr:phage portal protein [Escherichia coli]EEX0353974.1 phage portal protein [Escherichia coli]EGD4731777.1 phage portal protein [Escherichia coli]EGD5076158.1 phage portal protein [Escherichia coli]MKP37353.1 phage portal protein [Escherichia coli]
MNNSMAFTFGEPEALLDRREILNYLECVDFGKWYAPPVDFNSLALSFRASAHHTSPICVKRNVLVGTFIPHPLLTRQAFSRLALDYLVFGNAYLERQDNRLGQPLTLVPALAKYVRRGKALDSYFFVQPGKVDHEFASGSIGHLLEPDINQEIYGLPEYLSALNSAWLDNSATLFRRRYYKNGSHAGFILYLSDPAHNEADIGALQEALANSRGPGNFRNLLMYLPNGKPDSVKVIPIGEVAAKDNFSDIKSVSRDDQLAAHRVPPALMGVVPSNAGGFGDAIKAAKVFNCNEIEPLQERFKELNDWLGLEVIRFKKYRLADDDSE